MEYFYTVIVTIISIALIAFFSYMLNKRRAKEEESPIDVVPKIIVNIEDLEKHAEEISRGYSSVDKKGYNKTLIESLDRSFNNIVEAHEKIEMHQKSSSDRLYAAEWILDNMFLIQKEYKYVKNNVPKNNYRNLPILTKGIMKDYPRVYHIAVEIVSHTDGRVDEEIIERFVKAYEKNTILSSKELWMLPIMIRIALIQNISNVAKNVLFAQEEKIKGDLIAERIIDACHSSNGEQELEDIFKEQVEFTYFFGERLFKILKDNGIENNKVYDWINDNLEIKELNYQKLIIEEHKKEAAMQLSMGNSINSIRTLEGINWREYFKKLSYVESLLMKDPVEVYPNMDFDSQDYYRYNIEKLSKKFNLPESFIVKKALECAEECDEQKCCENHEEYKRHVGYYLIDDGIKCLRNKLNLKEKSIDRVFYNLKNKKVAVYIGSIILGTILVMSIFISLSLINDRNIFLWKYILAFIVLIVPCSEIVISILNWSINYLSTPRFVPKMELKDGIDEDNSTVVIIPTIINNKKRAEELVEHMEIYYLANKLDNLYFALLGDLKDSQKEKEDDDDEIIKFTLEQVKKLNKKYSSGKDDIFYYFCRPRKYNEKEAKWLAWERKRGKIMEFNNLLRGDKNTSFNFISGNIEKLKECKYVITLDADTKLPRNAARKLIGAMSHVLNQPVIDEKNKKVIRGYGLLQPRISVDVISANKTLYSKIFSGEVGIDVYTKAISDVYQDSFGEGIFTGKGIYNVDVFNYMLKDKVPENTVLSHDLLEGSYVKAGLVTDIELIDGYPAYYNSSSKRLHRWARGDWQLLPWIFKGNGLNALSRWKLIDNLRRSLLAPSIMLLVALSFNVLPDGTDKWIVAAILASISPILFDVTEFVTSPIKGISLSGRISSIKTVFYQVFLIIGFIPYQGCLMLDAIIKTLYRLTISKKNLLEWQTAEDAERKSGKTLISYIRFMWKGSFLSLVICVLAFLKSTTAGISMLPFTIVWFLSPAIAYYISKDIKIEEEKLQENELRYTRSIARRTWAYFEDFVNEKNNWLAPDNYQEYPHRDVAPRTSPTNLGMGLISNIVAYDLGYIGILQLVYRMKNSIENMNKLKKLRGHFYNWYNTKTGEPLNPKYISTVDSGNLVGYLWVIEESLKEYVDNFKNSDNLDRYIMGLEDTALLAEEEIAEKTGEKNYYSDIFQVYKNEKINANKFIVLLENLKIKCEKANSQGGLYWNNKLKASIDMFNIEVSEIFLEYDQDKTKQLERQEISKNQMVEDEIVNKNIENKQLVQKYIERKQTTQELVKADIKELIKQISHIAENTDFTIVFHKERELFSIGYDVEKNSIGNSYYDLLASEARQATFVAIAKGDISEVVWFKLGRALTKIKGNRALVSWSGTMFEYFMPLLIMRDYKDTLLHETYNAVFQGQINYASSKGVPWGISESAFYYFDKDMNYQYKAFGVPGIGVKRGLSDELVVSPYSTILVMQMHKKAAIANLHALEKIGALGRYGFYESIDYTKNRLKCKDNRVVKCFMVHHEGMSFMALDNVLKDNILQKRFHNIPRVKAAELLLQERIPKTIVYDREENYSKKEKNETEKRNIIVRQYHSAKTAIPRIHLLSNGEYSLMISNSGSGYSKKGDMHVYRWREDVTLDDKGMFFYIKDLKDNQYYSATYEPCKNEGEDYQVLFSLDRVGFKRKDADLTTFTEIIVSGEDNGEIRKITITNNSTEEKVLEVTSYCEVTLNNYSSDLVHPAFQNLFIQTEYNEERECIIATRRGRKKEEKKPWLMQVSVVKGQSVAAVQYETSRANFIGRGRDLKNPICMDNDVPLKNTVGTVLDPIIAIRRKIKIQPGSNCEVIYTTALGDSKEELIELAKKYSEYGNIERNFTLAWTEAQLNMKYLGIKSSQANLYQSGAANILFTNSSHKERQQWIKNIKRSQKDLWKYGISGDLPIILITCREKKHIDSVRQIIKAHEYWNSKGLTVDLVILNEEEVSYMEPIQNLIRELILGSSLRDKQNRNGGVFLLNRASMEEEDINFIKAIARMVIDGEKNSFINCMKDREEEYREGESLQLVHKDYNIQEYKYEVGELQYFNGYGGFSPQGHKYTIILKDSKDTPAPWINVISNKWFGFHVSERGSCYTWCLNSRENKVTTWSNDPVIDPSDEVIYLRDEFTGELWNVTPAPIRHKDEYVIEHGFGYSNFTHAYNGILGKLTMFVPVDQKVKVCNLTLKNLSSEAREISATYYSRLVLGVSPQQTGAYISSYFNEEEGYIYGSNPYNESFGHLKAYLKVIGGEEESYTGDRKEFIGRGGDYKAPKALKNKKLSNTVGAGMDPCLAYNSKVHLEPNEEKTLVILLGQEEDIGEINSVVSCYEDVIYSFNKLEEAKDYWRNILGIIRVKTPEPTFDIMLNGWLVYQTIACRIWARTAFYQSGGAFGFRDQLQDVMPLAYLDSSFTKEQILYAASRQYLEGDVQHWWHPIVDSGIRTRFSDDLLWLPYVTADYIKNTGDYSILEEKVAYLEDEPLKEGEDERYNISRVSKEKGSIYEHCIRAIDKSLKFGVHNIPLMGSGDWNDGMSTVGNEGKGESVWLGWFLYSILDKFANLCTVMDDKERKDKYEEYKEFIRENLEKNAWDGKWYRRAYFDDETPLGSRENEECQIDSLAQSWAVISGAADKDRAKEAMKSLDKYLIKENKGMVLLLTPPFYKSNLEPGYIKGYVPGVRENGGQYTHSVTWVIRAYAKMGKGDKALRIYNMINPINHTRSYLECETFKTEPYVMTADVYGKEPHEGRGGWSWYTGTSSWMYRVGIEDILGIKLKEEKGFTIEPCVPKSWKEYSITYKRDDALYNIKVLRGNKKEVKLDGKVLEDLIIPYLDKGEYSVEVLIL